MSTTTRDGLEEVITALHREAATALAWRAEVKSRYPWCRHEERIYKERADVPCLAASLIRVGPVATHRSSAGMTPRRATRKILGPKILVDLGRGSQVDRTVDHDRAAASGEDLPTRQIQRRHAFLLLDHLGQSDLRECEDHAADT